jgi:hypothetical protein
MTDEFMRHEDGSHHRLDEGLYLHYPGTCNVHDISQVNSGRHTWAPRETAIPETRLATSRLGFVAICYEIKGRMTFFVQLSHTRAAWQRLEWETNFVENWDEKQVHAAIDNFLWVAECENAGKVLPKVR